MGKNELSALNRANPRAGHVWSLGLSLVNARGHIEIGPRRSPSGTQAPAWPLQLGVGRGDGRGRRKRKLGHNTGALVDAQLKFRAGSIMRLIVTLPLLLLRTKK